MKNNQIPIFRTERLILREITEADAPSYEENFVTYDVISQLTKVVPWPYPKGGVLEYIKTEIVPTQGKDKWVWGITLKDNPDELIGAVELCRETRPANRGFWLGKKFWGQGIMTEVVIPITNYAFDVLDFEKLIFVNALGNDRSRRIKEKTGAKFIRVEPGEYVNPKYTQREVWELTKQEWHKLQSR